MIDFIGIGYKWFGANDLVWFVSSSDALITVRMMLSRFFDSIFWELLITSSSSSSYSLDSESVSSLSDSWLDSSSSIEELLVSSSSTSNFSISFAVWLISIYPNLMMPRPLLPIEDRAVAPTTVIPDSRAALMPMIVAGELFSDWFLYDFLVGDCLSPHLLMYWLVFMKSSKAAWCW